jgi:hypothetical protein
MGVESKGQAGSHLFGDNKAATNELVQLEKGWSSNFNSTNLP